MMLLFAWAVGVAAATVSNATKNISSFLIG